MASFYGTMPSELPKTLPAGTRTISGWTATSELRLEGAAYAGPLIHDVNPALGISVESQWIDWAKIPIQSPPQEELGLCDACGGKARKSVCGHDHVGVIFGELNHLCASCWDFTIGKNRVAILARRAAKEIKVGDYVSGRNLANTCRIAGNFVRFEGCGIARIELGDGSIERVMDNSLRREEEPKPAEAHELAAGARLDALGSMFGVPRGHCENDQAYRERMAASIEQPKRPRIDGAPYPQEPALAANVAFDDWSAKQSGIASGLTKREQAKRQLTHGVMRNRDRYGQRLSLVGWPEADDSEP
jgi:hypothetical protein